MGYSPLHTGVAFLPFSAGIVVAAMISSKLVGEGRPALARRRRHGDGRARAAACSRGSASTTRPTQTCRGGERRPPRQHGELLDRPVPVHRADVAGHGPDLRAAHADRRPRRRRTATPASAPGCSTPCSRSAARSAWRRCRTVAVHFTQDKAASLVAAAQARGAAVRPTRAGGAAEEAHRTRSPSPRARPTRSSPAPG